ncbi:MAG: hypothetical protein ACREH3_16140, partial [Geminicoccales bacterium]
MRAGPGWQTLPLLAELRTLASVEAAAISAAALVIGLLLFGVFVALFGHDPLAVYRTLYIGAFGSWFSI